MSTKFQVQVGFLGKHFTSVMGSVNVQTSNNNGHIFEISDLSCCTHTHKNIIQHFFKFFMWIILDHLVSFATPKEIHLRRLIYHNNKINPQVSIILHLSHNISYSNMLFEGCLIFKLMFLFAWPIIFFPFLSSINNTLFHLLHTCTLIFISSKHHSTYPLQNYPLQD